MDHLPPEIKTHSLSSNNIKKARLNEEQMRVLESSFHFNSRLDPNSKAQLAHQLGLSPRRVAVWYQNKRARWKTMAIELENNALQHRLNNALEEKEKLEKEVARLKQELYKTQRLPQLSNTGSSSSYTYVSSFADSGNEGSSWVIGESKIRCMETELYACLIDKRKGCTDQ